MGILKNVGRTVGVVGGSVTVKILEFIVEYQEEGNKRVCENHTSKEDQNFLTNASPRGVADTREDRLYQS